MTDMTAKEKKAREEIFARIRKGKPESIEAPEVPMYKWPGDPVENFRAQLKDFDGNSIMFGSRQEAIDWLEKNVDKSNKVVCSAVPDYQGTVTADDYPDPHKCTDIDVCVCEGILGIGEMGSILLSDKALGKPACALLSVDMFVLLDKTKIVDGVHTAYSKFSMDDYAYSSFFSGPSATADIEAVHVTGAQAEISLTALLY